MHDFPLYWTLPLRVNYSTGNYWYQESEKGHTGIGGCD